MSAFGVRFARGAEISSYLPHVYRTSFRLSDAAWVMQSSYFFRTYLGEIDFPRPFAGPAPGRSSRETHPREHRANAAAVFPEKPLP